MDAAPGTDVAATGTCAVCIAIPEDFFFKVTIINNQLSLCVVGSQERKGAGGVSSSR